jgi:hypothetical protein
LNLGVLCTRLVGLHEQFLGVFAAAVLAAGCGKLARAVLDPYLDATWPKVAMYLEQCRAEREQRRQARKLTAA